MADDLKIEELEGRILVVETIAWSTMSLLFSVSKPSPETTIQFMDAIKEAVKAEGRAKSLSAVAMNAAERYADELLTRVSENLDHRRRSESD